MHARLYVFGTILSISGKYLAVVRDHSTDTVSAELVMTPTLEQSLFCMLSSPVRHYTIVAYSSVVRVKYWL